MSKEESIQEIRIIDENSPSTLDAATEQQTRNERHEKRIMAFEYANNFCEGLSDEELDIDPFELDRIVLEGIGEKDGYIEPDARAAFLLGVISNLKNQPDNTVLRLNIDRNLFGISPNIVDGIDIRNKIALIDYIEDKGIKSARRALSELVMNILYNDGYNENFVSQILNAENDEESNRKAIADIQQLAEAAHNNGSAERFVENSIKGLYWFAQDIENPSLRQYAVETINKIIDINGEDLAYNLELKNLGSEGATDFAEHLLSQKKIRHEEALGRDVTTLSAQPKSAIDEIHKANRSRDYDSASMMHYHENGIKEAHERWISDWGRIREQLDNIISWYASGDEEFAKSMRLSVLTKVRNIQDVMARVIEYGETGGEVPMGGV